MRGHRPCFHPTLTLLLPRVLWAPAGGAVPKGAAALLAPQQSAERTNDFMVRDSMLRLHPIITALFMDSTAILAGALFLGSE